MEENGVARVLKQVLIYENSGGIEQVAEHLHGTYDYVWSQTAGRVNPSVHVIRGAYEVTGDPKLARLLTPVGYQLTPMITPSREVGPYETEIGDLDMAVSTLRRLFRTAMEDNVIDNKEADKIHGALNTLRKEMADIEGLLIKYKK